MHNELSDVFSCTGYFKGTFSFKVKVDAKPYQAALRHVPYTLKRTILKDCKNSRYWCH